MSTHQQGQILYLGGSNSPHGSPGGSLSTRFQKLAQSRNSGIIVVNQPTTVEHHRPGKSLGLGYGTGLHPSGSGGQRISSSGRGRGRGGNGGGGNGAPITTHSGGIHTKGGLARAMQERGGGVTDAFLLTPDVAFGGAGGGSGHRKNRGAGAGAGAGVAGAAMNNTQNNNTRASRHKALVLGNRPGKKQAGGGGGTATVTQRQQQQSGKTGRGGAVRAGVARVGAARAGVARVGAAAVQTNGAGGKKGASKGAVAAAGGGGGKGGDKGKGKGKGKGKAGPPKAGDLDSELSEYMMKNEQTAASLLDNDLDTYMSEKPQENPW